jgi:hypothetical protein
VTAPAGMISKTNHRLLSVFSEHTPRSTSCSLLQKLCSSNVYMIRPRPNEGSMTFGVNSRTIDKKSGGQIREIDLHRLTNTYLIA